jgi:hypothetical protein
MSARPQDTPQTAAQRSPEEPYPHNLEGVRQDMDYWVTRQGEGEPGSNWEVGVHNRLTHLRNLESRFREQEGRIPPPTSAVQEGFEISSATDDRPRREDIQNLGDTPHSTEGGKAFAYSPTVDHEPPEHQTVLSGQETGIYGTTLEISDSAADVLSKAQSLASESHRRVVTTSCLLFAFAETATNLRNTSWFVQDVFAQRGNYGNALKQFQSDATDFEEGDTVEGLAGKFSLNARTTIETAKAIASRVGRGARGFSARHLFAALLVAPQRDRLPIARQRLQDYGFDLSKLSSDFFYFLRSNEIIQDENVREWQETLAPAGEPSSPSLSVPAEPDRRSPSVTDVGPSTHVARDRWTTEDALGYFPYAYAIARFLTNPQTSSPLAISIQAPWGGGKTSMMRMIQAQLDPQQPGLIEAPQVFPPSEVAVGATVGEISKELNGSQLGQAKIETDPMKQNGRLTVWFNAWKYESTNQIWAGLADAIVTQVANRLPVMQKELFFFRLHLKRLEVSKIRTRITNDLVSSLYSNFIRLSWLYLLVPVFGFVVHVLAKNVVPVPWRSISVTADFLIAVIQSFKTKIDFDKKPATITLGELITAPDYDANLGFVHHVTEDLRRTLELIPRNRPLVIFIDDLDRCSPNKVADVVEAINLFLAGEFEHCMFVLGIDAEVVAAALNKSHGDVFAQMPSYAKTTPVGWRFMDKFVQLPFVVPPPDQAEMASYARSLLITTDRSGRVSLSAREQVASSLEKEHSSNKPVQEIVQQVQKDLKLDDTERDQLLKDAVTIKKMDENIRSFTDNEELLAERIVSSVTSYSRNPRDVKRFVNSFRFYYFLRSAREARNQAAPSLAQLSRWIVLSLRWPGIIRWLRGRGLVSEKSAVRDLALLETAAQKSSSLAAWVDAARETMRLTDKEMTWLSDEEMHSFFAAESKLPEAERLSASIGKGLW